MSKPKKKIPVKKKIKKPNFIINFIKSWQSMAAVIAAVGFIVSGVYAYNSQQDKILQKFESYVEEPTFVAFVLRSEKRDLEQDIRDLNKRLWDLEDRIEFLKKMRKEVPVELLKSLLELKEEKKSLEAELDDIRAQQRLNK